MRLLSTSEVAERTGLSDATVERMARAGLVRHIRVGHLRAYLPQGLGSLKRSKAGRKSASEKGDDRQ
jgi:excisionase family DNA binding protein